MTDSDRSETNTMDPLPDEMKSDGGYVPISELEQLAAEWEEEREDPIKKEGAKAQLWICAHDLQELIAEYTDE
jgi:hypothetical protein